MAHELSMYSGDSRILHIAVRDGSGTEVDVSGALAVNVGLFDRTGQQKFIKTLGNGVSVADHVITVVLQTGDTSELAGDHILEIELVTASGETYTVFQDKIKIRKDYIHSE